MPHVFHALKNILNKKSSASDKRSRPMDIWQSSLPLLYCLAHKSSVNNVDLMAILKVFYVLSLLPAPPYFNNMIVR